MMVDSLKGITIGELDLGSADGAREAKNEKFSKLFYEKQSDYKLIRHNPDKFLITGKKGSGKTYLAKYLQYKVQKEGALSHTITWDDINLNRLIEFEESNNEDDNELFYKYVIYIEIAKAVISCPTYKLAKPFFHSIKYLKALYYKDKIKRFYNERYPSGNYSIEHIKHNTESSSKVDLDTVIKGLGVSNELLVSDEYTIKKNQIFRVLNRLENLINDYMRVIPVILVSDDLDEQEMSLLSDQGFKEFLIRYLNVTNIINQNIQNYNSKCIVVIRDDLLDTVQSKSSNINKLITDATVLINWCEKADKKPWEYEIAKMIINKIRVSANIDSKISDKKIYNHFFTKMGNQSGMDYFISRSLGRPRDIIVYLNKIKDNNEKKECFSASSIRNTEQNYSRYFVNEFINELSIYYDSEYIDQGINLLINYNRKQFSFDEINSFFLENKEQYPDIKDLKELLDVFYRISLLGNIDQGTVSFAYRPEGKPWINYNARFIIHYGAQKRLVTKF